MNWQSPEKGDSYNAETAVFAPKDSFVLVDGETVQGWQSADDVVRLLTIVARQKSTVKRIRTKRKG